MFSFRLSPLLCFFLCALSWQTTSALIVWEGKVVPEWPDQHLAPLGKGTAGSAPVAPWGFYSHPQAITYGLTLIVDFSDQPANFTSTQVDNWLNQPGYAAGNTRGSVRDYFLEVSNGQLDLHNDVFGYYRARNPKSYYENDTTYTRAVELVNEMIAYFDPTVDFSKYDNDKNGTTEAISFVYAGSGQVWAQGLWPHAGYIGVTKDGVRIGRYNMSDMGTAASLPLYVFAHETGHMVFGWPDLYWFGDYCLMGNRPSDWNPPAINDFYRADQGWLPTFDITSSTNATYQAWHNGAGYRYINPAEPKEMFFWSIVKNTGRWSNLRGRGVLLYHFNGTITNGNTSGSSRSLYVVEADGDNAMSTEQWPSPGSAATDFFYQTNKTEFSSTTAPVSSWGLRIYNISAIADTMSFSVGMGTPILLITDPQTSIRRYGSLRTEWPLFNLKGARIKRTVSGTEPLFTQP